MMNSSREPAVDGSGDRNQTLAKYGSVIRTWHFVLQLIRRNVSAALRPVPGQQTMLNKKTIRCFVVARNQ